MEIQDAEFEEKVINASKEKLVIVDFWAPWCGPCNMLKPILEKVKEEYGDKFELVKVNVDDNAETANKYGVSGIPDVKFFKNKEIVDGFVGLVSEDQVKEKIDKNL